MTEEYKSPEEIAQIFFSELEEKDKNLLKNNVKSAEDMIIYHFGVGRQIRNRFGLWKEDNPYTNLDGEENNPDEVSHRILERIWELSQE